MRTLALICLAAAAAACGSEAEREAEPQQVGRADTVGAPAAAPTTLPAPAAERPPAASADSTDWTSGQLSAPSTVTGGTFPLPISSGLRTGVHAGFERLAIDLQAPGGLPGYQMEYVDRPLHDCGSGEATYPVGDAWLQIRLEPAQAHTEEGQPSAGPRQIPVDAPVIQRIYRTCDFEGVVVLVLAVSRPNPFRVMTLPDPPRIVVDVQR